MADSDFSQLVSVVGKLAAVLAGPDLKRITSRVAFLAKQDALQALDGDLPGRKFTHWRPKLGVGYEITSDTTATLAPRPGGPWKVLDEGRSPGGKYSRKRRRFVAWGSTHGRHTWQHAVVYKVGQETPGRVDDEVQKSIREALS